MHHKSSLKVLTAAKIVLSLSVPVAQAESAPTNQRNACNFDIPSTDVTVEGRAILLGIDDYLLTGREYIGTYLSTPAYCKEPALKPELNPSPILLSVLRLTKHRLRPSVVPVGTAFSFIPYHDRIRKTNKALFLRCAKLPSLL